VQTRVRWRTGREIVCAMLWCIQRWRSRYIIPQQRALDKTRTLIWHIIIHYFTSLLLLSVGLLVIAGIIIIIIIIVYEKKTIDDDGHTTMTILYYMRYLCNSNCSRQQRCIPADTCTICNASII